MEAMGQRESTSMDHDQSNTDESERPPTSCSGTSGASPSKRKDKNGRNGRGKQQLLEDIQTLKAENQNLKSDKELLQNQLADIRQQLLMSQECCCQIKAEHENLLQRYSQAVSSRLLDQNPAIKEIGILDEPTVIAEDLRSKLYGNQWCEAMDVLSGVVNSEKQQLEMLRDMLMDTYLLCTYTLTQQADGMRRSLYPFGAEGSVTETASSGCALTDALGKLPEHVRHQFTDVRRHPGREFLENCYKEQCESASPVRTILAPYGETLIASLKPYVMTCLELCWAMLLQKPPMNFDFLVSANGSGIDPDVCDLFSFPGSKVDFVVWPVLYRHVGGGVMSKGIVQAVRGGAV